MAIPGEDPLRIGAIVLIVVAGILAVIVFVFGGYRFLKDCKKKREEKRAAEREQFDFDSITYDQVLDERDHISEGSDDSLFVRTEPVIRELHFPVIRANEVQMADSLQTVGNLSSFTNVGNYYDEKGWGSPSHQALYRGEDRVVETNYSVPNDSPAWHTPGGSMDLLVNNQGSRENSKTNQLQFNPSQREMNNFAALQIASQSPLVYHSPKIAAKKPKGSQLYIPATHSASNLAAVQLTTHNFQNSPRGERKLHTNAYFINDDNRTDYSDFHEVKVLKARENPRPGRAQNVRTSANNLNEPSRAPVLGKDAEYWNYVTSKVRTPTPDLTRARYTEPKKGAKGNKGQKVGKREKIRQHEVKHENPRERSRQSEVKQEIPKDRMRPNEEKQGNAWEITRQKTAYEDWEEYDTDKTRPLTRTERSLSTKKKEDLLVSELKAKLGQRHGAEEVFF